MITKWNLDELYTSFDDPKIMEDQKKLEKLIEEYKRDADHLKECDDETIVADYINYQEKFNQVISRLNSYAHLVLSVDTMNEKAGKMEYRVSQYSNQLIAPTAKYKEAIYAIEDIDTILKKLDQEYYAYILHELQNKGKHDLSVDENDVVAKMNISGANAWAKLKNQVIGTHLVEYKGKKVPLTVVLNEAYSNNAKDRKEAYEAEIASYEGIEQTLAACLSNIKISANIVSKLKGYEHLIDKTMDQSRLSKKTLDTMLSVMKKHRPSFEKYYQRKAELLGHDHGLPWYEMFASVVESTTVYSYEEACEIVIREFGKFCQEESDFMKHAIENGWIDVYPREGKRGGAFCSHFGDLNQSRIMLNYGGSYLDVSTLAHELGHGFHSYCMNDEAVLNKKYTMPIAETASTFNEVLLAKSMLKVVNDQEKIAILDASITNDLQVLVDIYSRYIFETNVVNEVERDGQLSAKRINTLMLEAQKEAYGSGLDPDYLHPYMWTWKPHYYYADLNFYNFPYAFGNLLAHGLYALYQKEGPSFANKYMEFLKNTGKASIEDIALSIGIELNEEFFEESIQSVEEDIQLFMELTENA